MNNADYQLSRSISHKREILKRIIKRADDNSKGSSKVLDIVELAKTPLSGDSELIGSSTSDRIRINSRLNNGIDRIISRADRDPLGTEKVADMRRAAVEALGLETIVGVAVQYAGDLSDFSEEERLDYPSMITASAPRPHRHFHLLHPLDAMGVRVYQGFITNMGRYVDRKEALEIALQAGQPMNNPPRGDKLFSEDLW